MAPISNIWNPWLQLSQISENYNPWQTVYMPVSLFIMTPSDMKR